MEWFGNKGQMYASIVVLGFTWQFGMVVLIAVVLVCFAVVLADELA